MERESRQAHWENVYAKKSESEVSWFQDNPAQSLDLMAELGATADTAIIDIGGGASRVVDCLVEKGFRAVTVLDVSQAALKMAQARLGDRAAKVRWVVADATTWQPQDKYDIWHDRAAFHFLTGEPDRAAYVTRMKQALRAGGHAIIATFALDGPDKCSGLPVKRYDAAGLRSVLGQGFTLMDTRSHAHLTPWGTTQSFQFSVFRLDAAQDAPI